MGNSLTKCGFRSTIQAEQHCFYIQHQNHAEDNLLNNGREYTFNYPEAQCGAGCTALLHEWKFHSFRFKIENLRNTLC